MLATITERLRQTVSSVVPRKIVAPALVCPHCERELGESHDDATCQRRMTRRYFFGVCAGAAVTVAAAPVIAQEVSNPLISVHGWHGMKNLTIQFAFEKGNLNEFDIDPKNPLKGLLDVFKVVTEEDVTRDGVLFSWGNDQTTPPLQTKGGVANK